MGVWDNIRNLVKDVLVSEALREQLALAEKQALVLETTIADLKVKITTLEEEKQGLQMDKTNLQQQVRNLEEQLAARSRDRLEPLKERILNLLISTSHETASVLADELGANEELIKFHLMEMKKSKLVLSHPSLGESSTWTLAQEGRRYLITHGLLQEVVS